MKIPWTDERVARLRKHHAEGFSFTQIAKLLGVTKNACVGKANRLGLRSVEGANRSRINPGASASLRKTPTAIKAVTNAASGFARRIANQPAIKPEPKPMPAKPVLLSGCEKVWTERVFGECAFPVAGEGADTLSCCAPTSGATYCRFHRSVMFTSPEPTPRRKRTVREPTFYDVEAA